LAFQRLSKALITAITALNLLPSTATTASVNRCIRRHNSINCLHTLRMALPISKRKLATVLKSGASRLMSHINSILRWTARLNTIEVTVDVDSITKHSGDNSVAVASIWERFIDKETGQIIFTFSMLTINADGHEVMEHFHKPEDEKRSVVVLQDQDYLTWLNANHKETTSLLHLAPNGFLESLPEEKLKAQQTLSL